MAARSSAPAGSAPAGFLVIGDDGMWVRSGKLKHSKLFKTANIITILEHAETFAADVVYIVPQSHLWKRARDVKAFLGAVSKQSEWTVKPPTLKHVFTGWRKRGTAIKVVFPAVVDSMWGDGGLDTVTDTNTFYDAVSILSELLGVPPLSPIVTGRMLIERTANPAYLRAPVADGVDWDEARRAYKAGESLPVGVAALLKCDEFKERDLSFKAPLPAFGDDEFYQWVHQVDKKRMYLSACTVPLGVGEPEHMTKAVQFGKSWAKYAGVWKVRAERHPNIYSHAAALLLPKVLEGWFYTPFLEALDDLGWLVDVSEAYIWRDSHQILNGFYKRLRSAADWAESNRHPVAPVVLRCVKAIYTRVIGWLATTRRGAETKGYKALYRPDWRSQIVSMAKARLLRNIHKAEVIGGVIPHGVRTDALIYFSPFEHLCQALPPLLTLKDGQFRHGYTLPFKVAAEVWERERHISRVDDELSDIYARGNNGES